MRFGHTYPPPGLVRFSNIAKVLSSLGALKQVVSNLQGGRGQASGADGDRCIIEFFCDGSETKLEITTEKYTDRGIFDLYVNDVLDSSSYDDYAAASTSVNREITLTIPVVAGRNTMELRVNTKNGASSGYNIRCQGVSIQ